MNDEPVQVAVFSDRNTDGIFAQTIEMGGGSGNLVKLLGVHYHIEQVDFTTSVLMSAGISSNPDHLTTPPVDFVELLTDKAIYGRASWTAVAVTTGFDSQNGVVVPLYGLIRPRKQVMIFQHINGGEITLFVAEVYYRSFSERNKVERDTINRKYGKHRRS